MIFRFCVLYNNISYMNSYFKSYYSFFSIIFCMIIETLHIKSLSTFIILHSLNWIRRIFWNILCQKIVAPHSPALQPHIAIGTSKFNQPLLHVFIQGLSFKINQLSLEKKVCTSGYAEQPPNMETLGADSWAPVDSPKKNQFFQDRFLTKK